MAAKVRLGRRLRSLRELTWPGTRVTQALLGGALGVSTASISSWESETNPAVPPVYRLEAYATFFATQRSVETTPFRVLPLAELTEFERERRNELLDDLLQLSGLQRDDAPAGGLSPYTGTVLQFPEGENITVVASELPQERLKQLPYSDPSSPDYVERYKYADLDALFELWGHLRAANPTSHVRVRVAPEMETDEYSTHLVLLGGVDWNPLTARLISEINLPVRQLEREDDATPGGFEVGETEKRILISPVLHRTDGREVLVEDVAHFYRSVNPYNKKRTVTICNGMYQRGTLGAVRALTDERFRERNEQYLRSRFAHLDTYSLISRVRVISDAAITPDWTKAEDRLHEWPAPAER